jgi:hypothetical protein
MYQQEPFSLSLLYKGIIMATQINLDLVWASSGGFTDPADVKYELGWIEEIPTFQNFNFVLNAMDNNMLALAERGHFDWQTEITYQVGAFARDGGGEYRCLVSNTGNQPSLDLTGSYWTLGALVGTGTLLEKEGIAVKNVNTRTANGWEGNDLTLENNNALISLKTTSGAQDNLLVGNVAGEAVVVNVGATLTPDDRSIALDTAGVSRVFHEGHAPTKAEIGLGNVDDVSYATILGAMNPVGTVVLRANDVDPNSSLPGVWVSKGVGHSLLAVAVGAGAGTVGGSSTVAVPLLEHKHTSTFTGSYTGDHLHSGPSHSHTANHNHSASSGTDSHNHSFTAWRAGATPLTYKGLSGAIYHFYDSLNTVTTSDSHSHAITVNTINFSTGAGGTGYTSSNGGHYSAGSITGANTGTAGATMDVSGATYKVVAWERVS